MDHDLLTKYGEARLPRYTSYPAATRFSDAVGPQAYERWLADLPSGVTGSLYLHVPFCRAMCWYCGCHTTVARRDAPIAGYLDALRREIALVAGRIGRRLPVSHVHFGGGTPTIMPEADLAGLVALLRERFDLRPGAELAVEIDPRTLTESMAAALGAAGFTRASLGVQSFDPVVQAAINRRQGFAETARAAEAVRRAGLSGLNLDLVYGLPHQTVASCLDTVRRCLELRADRFSVFGYAHVPGFKKHQRKIAESDLPGVAERRAQADAIAGALAAAGYVAIGLDHYAAPHDAMARALREGALRRNFQGYTTDGADVLLGFGASAIGRLPQGYVQNEVVLGRYAGAVGEGRLAAAKGLALTADDRLRADLIEQLMCRFAVDLSTVCARHGVGLDGFVEGVDLAALEADGVVRRRGALIEVPEDKRLLVRAVAAAFDAHLGAAGRAHSRAL
jgi:oxygen-independent coproporphyrinogen-3 oxidase